MSFRELADLVIVVRGGSSEIPPLGTVFSGAVGESVEEAAAYVPHGTIRVTTVGAILAAGGSVTLKPELTRSGKLNDHHVNVIEGSRKSSFSEPVQNPVPKDRRIH